jgi:hypothetical protein
LYVVKILLIKKEKQMLQFHCFFTSAKLIPSLSFSSKKQRFSHAERRASPALLIAFVGGREGKGNSGFVKKTNR